MTSLCCLSARRPALSKRRRVAVWAAGLLALLAVSAVQAAAPPPADGAEAALRERLLPAYQKLLLDPQFIALDQQMAGQHGRPEVVDRYLRFLPLPPREMLELDMFLRKYEVPIPREVEQWHRRWLELHPAEALALYGEEGLRRQLGDGGEGAAGEAAPELALRSPSLGTNRNVAFNFTPAPNEFQGEIQLVVDPKNANQLVAAANTWNSIPGVCASDTQAIFYSANGGASWGYTCAPAAAAYGLSCSGTVFGSDPALFWNDNHEVFLNYMLICRIGLTNHFSIVVAKSTDGGATWNGQGIVTNSWANTQIEDKNFYAIDNTPSSPFYGRHYTCWDRNNNEKSAYSTNAGATWTEVDLPPTPSTGSGSAFDLACELEVSRDGTVHVIYDTLRCLATCNNEQMFYSRSVDGGLTWSAPVLVVDFNLVGFSNVNCPPAQNNRCLNPFGAIGVDNSRGHCDGNLYVTYSDWTAGGVNTTDVWMKRSTDGGVTWSAPLRLNDDGAGGPTQFHPFLQVDSSNGDVVVAWHDTRNDAALRQVEIWGSRSTTCGQSVEPNIRISQPTSEFNNSTIAWSNVNTASNTGANPNQYGEYLGLSVLDQKAYVAWTDTRHYFPLFTTDPQDENLGFNVVKWDYCPLSKHTGRWNLPQGATNGSTKLALYDSTSTWVATLVATLVETSPGVGTLGGQVWNITGTTVLYNATGSWSIDTPPGSGPFTVNLTDPGTGNLVGTLGGRFRDDPLPTITGTASGTWRVCP